MSSSKQKQSEKSAAKYKVGQRVYTIDYHKTIPEEIIEGVVEAVITKEIGLGKNGLTETTYGYNIKNAPFPFTEDEEKAYPNFTEAAKVFAKTFLKPLK
jgi:hypothetical protein